MDLDMVLLILIGLIFLLGLIIGIYKGAIRIAVSVLTTIVTLVAVVIMTPYVTKLIINMTPVDDWVQSAIVEKMIDIAGGDAVYSEEMVRQAMDEAGITEAELELAGYSVDDIVDGEASEEALTELGMYQYLEEYVTEAADTEVTEADEDAAVEQEEVTDISRDAQVMAIENANLPEIFKEILMTNNNEEIYSDLGVQTFAQYVANYMTRLLINILAFLATFVLVTIILRAVVFALDIVSDLPMLGALNHLAGGVIGMGLALVVVWLMFIALTVLYMTSMGKGLYDTVMSNDILRMIYENNPIMNLATRM